jgi:hypothetical protein
MADPRIHAEVTKMPKRTYIDFFVVIIISSFLIFIFINKSNLGKAGKKGSNGH